MKYFIDTEFYESGYDNPIRLISIGLVCEDGREYYAEIDIDLSDVDDWLKKNVIPHLTGPQKSRTQIAKEILEFMGWGPCGICVGLGYASASDGCIRKCLNCAGLGEGLGANKPEFWGYFADYDWVLFCQLFGRMVDMPHGLPHICFDLKQLANQVGLSKEHLQQAPETLHHALHDARWNSKFYEMLISRSLK
jgi:hypothetical protein